MAFKIRASAASKLLSGSIDVPLTKEIGAIIVKQSEGKTLTPLQSEKLKEYRTLVNAPKELPTGPKTYCRDWWIGQRYERSRDFSSKYTSKGIEVEDAAIRYAEEVLGFFDWEKNEDHFANDIAKGTPDVLSGEYVIDLKSSFDCFTFPTFETEPNQDYVDQLQTYMMLTGKKKAILVYALMDTPDSIIMSECWAMARAQGSDEVTEDVFAYVKAKHTYSHLPPSMRIKAYFFDADPTFESRLTERVLLARDYISTLDVDNVFNADGTSFKL